MLGHMPPRPRRPYGAHRPGSAKHARRPAPRAQKISDLLNAGGHSFSFEFMPPRTAAAEEQLWRAIRELEPLRPTFVSVTYGAGGATRGPARPGPRRVAPGTTPAPPGP